MVRTKADCSGTRVSAAKAPRKTGGASRPAAAVGSPAGKGSGGGGNPYKDQPVPAWQKGIAGFLSSRPRSDEGAGSSGGSSEGSSGSAPVDASGSSSSPCEGAAPQAASGSKARRSLAGGSAGGE